MEFLLRHPALERRIVRNETGRARRLYITLNPKEVSDLGDHAFVFSCMVGYILAGYVGQGALQLVLVVLEDKELLFLETP